MLFRSQCVIKNCMLNSLWRGLTCGAGRELERRHMSLQKVGKRGIILSEEADGGEVLTSSTRSILWRLGGFRSYV